MTKRIKSLITKQQKNDLIKAHRQKLNEMKKLRKELKDLAKKIEPKPIKEKPQPPQPTRKDPFLLCRFGF